MLDTNWALFFGILGLYYFAKENNLLNNFLTILCLSLAIGTRLPFFIFSLSLILLSFFIEKKQFTRFFCVGAASWFIGGLYYLPALYFYDWNVFSFLTPVSIGDPSLLWTTYDRFVRFIYKGFYFFGIPFCIVFVMGLFSKKVCLIFRVTDIFLKFSFLVVIFCLFLFFRYPYSADYFLPAFPFLLVLISKLFNNQKILWSLFVGLFLLNLVNFNVLKPDVPLNATATQWGFWIEKGILLKDVSKRVSTPPKLF